MGINFTVIAIFGTLFLSLVASLIYAYWYQSIKHGTRKGAGDASGSIRVSELEGLIHKAVANATRSLEDRLAGLEVEVRTLHGEMKEDAHRKLPGRSVEPLLGGTGNEPEEDLAHVPVRRREN